MSTPIGLETQAPCGCLIQTFRCSIGPARGIVSLVQPCSRHGKGRGMFYPEAAKDPKP